MAPFHAKYLNLFCPTLFLHIFHIRISVLNVSVTSWRCETEVRQLTTETFHYKTSATFPYSLVRHFPTGTTFLSSMTFLYWYDIYLKIVLNAIETVSVLT